jgi:hypothetical protein
LRALKLVSDNISVVWQGFILFTSKAFKIMFMKRRFMNLGKNFLIFHKISYEWFNRLMNPFQRLGDFLLSGFLMDLKIVTEILTIILPRGEFYFVWLLELLRRLPALD